MTKVKAKENNNPYWLSQGFRIETVLLLVLAVLGMILSAYLWWYKFQEGEAISCDISGGGCDEILTGKYSEMFNIPIATWGFFFYATFFLVSFQKLFIKHFLIDSLLIGLLLSGILYTLWLRYLEFFVIGGWCQWCWLSVIIIVIASGLMFRLWWVGEIELYQW